MKIIYGKAMWGSEDTSLSSFLARTRASDFDATEINLAALAEPPEEAVALHRDQGLLHVSQLVLEGDTAEEQLRFLDHWFPIALAHDPLHINFHSGRDFFSFEDNLKVILRIISLGEKHGIAVFHETHRGRAFYSAVETRKYLEACPQIRLNSDFSHWMAVHESDLRNQPEAMALAIRHSGYIHARVGYEEGPQVTHPRAPEWRGHLENHLSLWRRVVQACREAGQARLVITPEFGPPTYMHTLPFTNQPVADTWETNVAMLEILKETLDNE